MCPLFFKHHLFPNSVFQELPIDSNDTMLKNKQNNSLPHLHFLFLLKTHPFPFFHLHCWIHLTRSPGTWCVLLFLLFQSYCALFYHLCFVVFWTLAMAERQEMCVIQVGIQKCKKIGSFKSHERILRKYRGVLTQPRIILCTLKS